MRDSCTCRTVDIRLFYADAETRNVQDTIRNLVSPDGSGYRSSLACQKGISIVFAEADRLRSCKQCKDAAAHIFDIPDIWWSSFCRNSNGYFGYEEIQDKDGRLSGAVTWCRVITKRVAVQANSIIYDWAKLNVVSRWYSALEHTSVVVFDAPTDLIDPLAKCLISKVRDLQDPFLPFPSLMSQVLEWQDRAVWNTRNLVRAVEKNRATMINPRPDYTHLHEIARHNIHINETISQGVQVMEHLLQYYDQQHALYDTKSQAFKEARMNSLRFSHLVMIGLLERSKSNLARLENEIALVYHSVAQQDANTSLAIADAAKVDSSSMRTIALVTLMFLPSTFVCALFSTSFFNWDRVSDTWAVSGQFWIYWAVSIPLTAVALLSWLIWKPI